MTLFFQSMYTLMAKTEEVTHAMKVVQSNSNRMYPLDNLFLQIFNNYDLHNIIFININ